MNKCKLLRHPNFSDKNLESKNLNAQTDQIKRMEPSRKQVLRMMEIKSQLTTLETIEPIQRPA